MSKCYLSKIVTSLAPRKDMIRLVVLVTEILFPGDHQSLCCSYIYIVMQKQLKQNNIAGSIVLINGVLLFFMLSFYDEANKKKYDKEKGEWEELCFSEN